MTMPMAVARFARDYVNPVSRRFAGRVPPFAVVRHVGRWDARLLWMVLGERMSFVNAAAAFGRGGYRGRRYAMDRFSDALAALAEVKAAKGRRLR